MRLIDADAFDRYLARAEFNAAMSECCDRDCKFESIPMYYTTESIRLVLNNMPTIEAVNVVRAKWLPIDEKADAFDCSECNTMVMKQHNYCQNCGAKMDAE